MPLPASRHFAVHEADGVLVVRDRRRVAPAVIGLPFLIAAGYIWYGAWLIVSSHVRAGTIGTPGGWLPMVAFLVPVGALFAWPGVRLTLHNRQVRMAVREAAVDQLDHYVVLRRVRRHRLGAFAGVSLQRNIRRARRSSDGRSTSGSHEFLSVELVPQAQDARRLRVAFEYEPAKLRPLAQHVAQYTALPLTDDLASVHYE